MNETIFLGGCPVIRPEGIYLNGVRVIRLGLHGVGVGDPGDLLVYRQAWEPFVAAHLELWRALNEILESAPEAQKCQTGIFDAGQLKNLPPEISREFCLSLSLTRIRISNTNPGGILTQWNSWKDKSSADIVAGASSMLEWLQSTILRIGGTYKDELTDIAGFWGLPVKLPDIPSFSTQQAIRARIEGAYITAKGVLQIVGYNAIQTLQSVSNVAQAVGEGLRDTAQALPKTLPTVAVVAAVAAVVVGGGLLIYYIPRRPALPAPRQPAYTGTRT